VLFVRFAHDSMHFVRYLASPLLPSVLLPLVLLCTSCDISSLRSRYLASPLFTWCYFL